MTFDQNLLIATTALVLCGILIARFGFRAQALRDRFEMYQWVEGPITQEQLSVANQLPEEYFERDVFEEFYEGNDERIVRYLAMLRRYHFIFYTHAYERSLADPYAVKVKLWIDELAKLQEFRDVHERYKRYYPKFTEYLESIL